MGKYIEKLVALSGTEHVSGYQRTSSTGKAVRVSSYTRSPGSMSNKDLAKEALAFMHKQDTYQGFSMAEKNRHKQIMTEVEKRRKANGFPSSLFSAANGEDSKIMNPSTAPNPDARAQMEKKSVLQLQTLANDGGVRKADRQHAADELKRRREPLSQGKETLAQSVAKVQQGKGGTMGQVADGLAKMGLGKSPEAAAKRASDATANSKSVMDLTVAYGAFRKTVRSQAKGAEVKKQKARAKLKALAEERGFELDMIMAQIKDPNGQKWNLMSGTKVS